MQVVPSHRESFAMPVSLKRHPDFACEAVTRIDVDATRSTSDDLRLRYLVSGKISGLLVPTRAKTERKDELWQHTCLEAFVRAPGSTGYAEFNFAPSTEWAAYEFDDYRAGMRNASIVNAPQIEAIVEDDRLILEATLSLTGLAGLSNSAPWRLALSAVIEETSGRKSYWAYAHPAGKADFHHRDSFGYELPGPR